MSLRRRNLNNQDKLTTADFFLIPAEEISNQTEMPETPLVSVVMMTRNHASYLKQAVESVLEQQCDFEIELLIGEDYSTDGTRALCEELQKKYPEHIRLIVADKNVGITPNFLRLVCRARGKYIALLEGDDYWTDPLKLQKQVALMEGNPDYAWCGARTDNRIFWVKEKTSYDLSDTLRRYIFHTSSIMFRTKIMQSYPKFPDVVGWISMVYAYLAEHGDCGFLDESVSYYRHHEGGLWTGKDASARLKLTWVFTDTMNEYFDGQYKNELYDRELWIFGMETSIQLSNWTWQRWIQNLQLLNSELPRSLSVLRIKSISALIRMLFQPITYAYLKMRRVAALKQRLSSLLPWLRS